MYRYFYQIQNPIFIASAPASAPPTQEFHRGAAARVPHDDALAAHRAAAAAAACCLGGEVEAVDVGVGPHREVRTPEDGPQEGAVRGQPQPVPLVHLQRRAKAYILMTKEK